MGNLGDDFLLDTALELFSDFADEIVLIGEPGSNFTGKGDYSKLYWPKQKTARRIHKEFFNQVNDLDYLAFAGGGWFAGDRGLREPLNWYLRTRKLKVSTIGICLGIGPFDGFITQSLGKKALSKIANSGMLSVRSVEDLKWARQLGIVNADLGTDLAFSSSPPKEYFGGKRSGCVVALPEIQKKWLHTLSPSAAAEKFIDKLSVENLDSTTFVSFQNGVHDDYAFWSKYFPHVEKVANLTQAIALMQMAEKVVAGRLHAGIAAVIAEVPEIALIGYHHKFDVLSDLGLVVGGWEDDFLDFKSAQKDLVAALSSTSRTQIVGQLNDLK
jgi:hypothetical protein